MIQICAWCEKQYGEKEPFDDPSETHGMCKICLAKQEDKLVEAKMKDNPPRCLTIEGGIMDDICEEVATGFGRKKKRKRKKLRRKRK